MKYIFVLLTVISSWFTIYPINTYAAESRVYDDPVSKASEIVVLIICSVISLCLAALFTYSTRKKR